MVLPDPLHTKWMGRLNNNNNRGKKSHHLSAHADVSCGTRGLIFGLSLHLYAYFYYTNTNSEGSDEFAHMQRLRAFLLDDAISIKIMCTWSYNVEASSHLLLHCQLNNTYKQNLEAQWLSGRVLVSRLRFCVFEPHQYHCVVSLSKTH